MKKLTLRDSGAKRQDSFSLNPLDIQVIWSENPRENYGDESFTMLKESIRAVGNIINPIAVTPNEINDGWKLSHGFRRYKAILELIEEGFNIEQVKVMPVYNKEDILINHIVLNNTTKELDDVELASCLSQLQKLTLSENMQELATRTGLPYQKVRSLLGFAEVAGTALKEAVKKDEISFSAASEIAQNSHGIENQMQTLDAAKRVAEYEGKNRITSNHVDKAIGKSKKVSKDLQKLRNLLIISTGFESVVKAIDSIDLESHEIIAILQHPQYEQ